MSRKRKTQEEEKVAETKITINGVDFQPLTEFKIDRQGTPPTPTKTTNDVEWSDVAGLTEAKEALREAIEHPIKYAALYKKYGKKPSRGVLLYGPPGCGKTMLGKAAATALRRAHAATAPSSSKVTLTSKHHSDDAFRSVFGLSYERLLGFAAEDSTPATDDGFIYVKAPEILNCYVGESEKGVRRLFDRAREYKKAHGHPAVLFIDEAEAILGHRSERHMSSTIVPMFLAEMDGFDDPGCFVILATNRPNALDPAVIREGRIDRKICIARPDEAQAADVFRVHLASKFTSDVDAEFCARELYSRLRVLYKLTYASQKTADVVLGDLMSGAAIATLIDRACEGAIARDVALHNGEASGLCNADVLGAIEQIEREYRTVSHLDDLYRIVEDAGEPVAVVQKAAKDGTFADVSSAFPTANKTKAMVS